MFGTVKGRCEVNTVGECNQADSQKGLAYSSELQGRGYWAAYQVATAL